MGVEEWFQGKIQSWNQERMFQYCQELSTAVQMNFEHLENKGPKIRIQSERGMPFLRTRKTGRFLRARKTRGRRSISKPFGCCSGNATRCRMRFLQHSQSDSHRKQHPSTRPTRHSMAILSDQHSRLFQIRSYRSQEMGKVSLFTKTILI